MNDVSTPRLESSTTTWLHNLRQHVLRWKFELRALIARHPSLEPLYQLAIWWTQYKVRHHIDIRECRIGSDTEFVLDGFQGSANTFATVAFKRSQSRPVLIAHHLHAPAQIIKAVEMNIPTLVTIRRPADTVLSLTSRWPYITVSQALRNYARFYEKIAPYTQGFVLSPFDQTTNHLDRVIQTVNRRFDTNFDLFEHTEDNVRAVRGPSDGTSSQAIRRKQRKARKAEQLKQDACQPLLRRADAIYERLRPHGVGA